MLGCLFTRTWNVRRKIVILSNHKADYESDLTSKSGIGFVETEVVIIALIELSCGNLT